VELSLSWEQCTDPNPLRLGFRHWDLGQVVTILEANVSAHLLCDPLHGAVVPFADQVDPFAISCRNAKVLVRPSQYSRHAGDRLEQFQFSASHNRSFECPLCPTSDITQQSTTHAATVSIPKQPAQNFLGFNVIGFCHNACGHAFEVKGERFALLDLDNRARRLVDDRHVTYGLLAVECRM
jgi:hypothetical protein